MKVYVQNEQYHIVVEMYIKVWCPNKHSRMIINLKYI